MNPEHPTVINAPRRSPVALLVLCAALLTACGGTNGSSEAATRSVPTKLAITAIDYGFEAPETIVGGAVEMILTNNGKEPHFAGLAAVAPGKTFVEALDHLVEALGGTRIGTQSRVHGRPSLLVRAPRP